MKSNKQFYIAVLWTVIAVVIAAVLVVSQWNNRKPQRAPSGVQQVGSARPPSPRNRRRTPPALTVENDQFVVISLNDLLISAASGSAEIVHSSIDVFTELVRSVKRIVLLYTTTQTQAEIETLLNSAGLFNAGFPKHRLVLTSTVEGRGSVAREIQPIVFVDSDPKVVDEISGKVPSAVLKTQASVGRYLLENFIGKDE